MCLHKVRNNQRRVMREGGGESVVLLLTSLSVIPEIFNRESTEEGFFSPQFFAFNLLIFYSLFFPFLGVDKGGSVPL